MNAPFAKSADWHAERLTGLGGSDANIILSGDAERVLNLWLEKTGQREPDNLDWILPVQIGSATEALNCAFFQHVTGRDVVERNKTFRRNDRAYMRCEIDGLTTSEHGALAILECKHVNAFATIEDVVQKYMPQMHHNMHCVGAKHAILSVFVGTLKHEIFEVALDDFYLAALLDAEDDFWRCVEARIAPEGCEPPAAPIAFEKLREVDFTGSNEWASFAADWLSHKDAAKKFETAAKGLKGLVEPDVGRAYGHGLQIKRSKSGSLTISQEK